LLILGYYYLVLMHRKDFDDKVHEQTEQLIKELEADRRN